MVTIIENTPGFGRIDANREKEDSPKGLEGIFSPDRKHSQTVLAHQYKLFSILIVPYYPILILFN
jgi:hypothetical protein